MAKVQEDKERHAAAIWDASTFTTYLVNVIGVKRIGPTEVILDKQAETSITRPELLWALEPADKEVWVNGVGGVQLKAHSTVYI